MAGLARAPSGGEDDLPGRAGLTTCGRIRGRHYFDPPRAPICSPLGGSDLCRGAVAYGVLLSKRTQVLSDIPRLPPGLLIAALPYAETGQKRTMPLAPLLCNCSPVITAG